MLMEDGMQDLSLISLSLVSITCLLLLMMGFQWQRRHNTYVQFLADTTASLGPRSINDEKNRLLLEREHLEQRHDQGKHRYKQLQHHLQDATKTIAQFKVGLEPPTFCQDEDEVHKAQIRELRRQQYAMISTGRAVSRLNTTTPDTHDHRHERHVHMLLRSFNAECESLYRRLRSSNLMLMQSKLLQAQAHCNKFTQCFGLAITDGYAHLKAQEMDAWYASLVDRIKAKHHTASMGRDSGYIYVLSNIGSFGKDTLLVGYTQDPHPEQVIADMGKEITPFNFNVHTLAFSEQMFMMYAAITDKMDAQCISRLGSNPAYFKISKPRAKQVFESLGVISPWYFDTAPRDFIESQLQRHAGQVFSTERLPSSLLPSDI